MGHTHAKLLVHVVFSTKGRRSMIDVAIRDRLYEYMVGVARKEFGDCIQVGGTDNHIHGLLLVRPEASIAWTMNRWKSLSSGWVHRTFRDRPDFAWQRGYGAFSVSKSKAAEVVRYIQSQPTHHKRKSYKDEFLAFLDRHEIEYDPADVWD